MEGMVRAAIAGAVLAIGALSLAGALVALALVVAYRKRPGVVTQALALASLLLNVVGDGYGALSMDEYAVVLIPGAVLTALAGLLYWRTAPPTGDDGRPLHGARWAVVLVAALLGAAALAREGAHMREDREERELSRHFEAMVALAHDPGAERSAREEAILWLDESGTCHLDGLDLAGFALPSLRLDRCSVVGTNLSGADLTRAEATMAKLGQTTLRGAKLTGADLDYADLQGADLQGADLRDASIAAADLRGADLRGADLRGASLSGSDLSGCQLHGATISVAQLTSAKSWLGVEGLSPELAKGAGVGP